MSAPDDGTPTRRQVRAKLLADLLAVPESTSTATSVVTLVSADGSTREHSLAVSPPPMVIHFRGVAYAREGTRAGKMLYRETEYERATVDEMGRDPTGSGL